MSAFTHPPMRFYSQHGEDFLLQKIFADVAGGFFVEIGCIDGRRFSNTLALEQRGWRGMCIEAHVDYIDLLRSNRPNSIIVHCAVGERDAEQVTFFANARGSLSTLDAAQETRWRTHYGEYFSGFEEQRVPMRTISSLLSEHGITHVDVLSLDVEGYEVQALSGLDLAQHRPRLLVIECDGAEQERGLDEILLPAGYHKGFWVGANIFYCAEPELLQAVVGMRHEVLVTHTQHPMDKSGDQTYPVSVDLTGVATAAVAESGHVAGATQGAAGLDAPGGNMQSVLNELRCFEPRRDSYEKAFELDRALVEMYAIDPSLLNTASADDPWVQYVLALSLEARGDYQAAVQQFYQVADLVSDDWRPFYHLALCADATRQAGWLHCGEEVHWEILKRYPDFAPSRQILHDNVTRFAFHGDPQYQGMVDELLGSLQVTDFVETGSFLGRSTAFVAQRWPGVQVHSTEINAGFFQTAQRRLGEMPNVHLHHCHSVQFITDLIQSGRLGELPVFFLDAHWEEDWPLPRELELIRQGCERAIIIIDDFRVPTQSQFSYDDYGADKVCAFEAAIPHLARSTVAANLLPRYPRSEVPNHGNVVGHVVLFQNCEQAFRSIAASGLGQRCYFNLDIAATFPETTDQGAGLVAPTDVVIRHAADRDFPVMVSFPRTGSHWLRLVLERYFDRPLLTRSFYAHDNDDYLLLHSHDMDMNLVRDDVLYLYRDPIETVYSQLRYHGEDPDNAERLAYWADLYGQHVNKWLVTERGSRRKSILCYEDLRQSPEVAFAVAIRHLGGAVDETKLRECIALVDRSSVKERTAHDARVVNLADDYAQGRERFRATCDASVWSAFLQGRDALAAHFQRPTVPVPRAYVPARHDAQDWEYKKIIGLVPGKNEARHIGFCLRALARFCDSIVYFDDDSTDETVAIVEALAQECRVERIIRKCDGEFHETIRRAVPLQAGRDLGGTHFIVIDADEAFTANLMDGDLLRRRILALQPGDALELAWIQLWRSVQQYRHDHSVWTNNYKAFAFADDRNSNYDETFIHLERVPSGLRGTRQRLDGYEYGLLHFQFVNWRNLLVKQAWYRCLERIHYPEKSAQAINDLYAPSKDEQDIQLRDVPYKWFAGYPFFESEPLQRADLWREQQVIDWLAQYDSEHFADLDIWDIDWGQGLGRTVTAPPAAAPAALVAEGERRFGTGDLGGARSCFVRALQLAPRQVTALNNLAVLSWQEGDTAQALLHVSAALEIDAHNREVVVNAAQILAASGGVAEALALSKAYLAAHPNDPELQALTDQLQGGAIPAEQDDRYWVSAIVSTYNSERFLRGCLEDLEAQTCADRLEIIVIDSGSEQNERAIVEEFQRHYDNIRYIRTERESLYAAWNRGVALARGRYLTNANCDDRHRRDALERMARTLDEHPAVSLVYGDCLITRVANETFAGSSADRLLAWPEFSVRQALQYCIFGPQPMWRRSAHDEIGLFDPDYKVAGDYDFFLRLTITHHAQHIAEPLGLYYEGDGLELGDPGRAHAETAQLLHNTRRGVALVKVYPALQEMPEDTVARAAALDDLARTLSGGLYPDPELAELCHLAALQLSSVPPEQHPVLTALPPLVAPEANRRAWCRPTPRAARLPGCSFCVISGGQRPDKLRRLIDSIHALAIPCYEIVVAGIAADQEGVEYLALADAAHEGRTSVLRNAAAARSRYDRIVFCDDDIVLTPGWYTGIEQALQDHDVAVGSLLNNDASRHWDWATIGGPAGHVMLDYGVTDSHLYLTSGLLAMRADVLEAEPWDEQRGYRQDEDVEFSQRLLRRGYRVHCCPESVAVHDDDQYTQVGHVILRRSAAGVQRWREQGWARCASAELLQAAEVCLRKDEWADAADWLRYLLHVEPGHSAGCVLWEQLEQRFGGPIEGLRWCPEGIVQPMQHGAGLAAEGTRGRRVVLQAVVKQGYGS